MQLLFSNNTPQPFLNTESCHLALLLFIKSTKDFLLSKSMLLGGDRDKELKEIFYSLPDDILHRCGYVKNLSSLGAIEAHINLFLSESNGSLKILMETEEKDLPRVCKEKFIHLQRCDYCDEKKISFVEEEGNSEWKDYKIHFRLNGLHKDYFVKKSGKFYSVVESIYERPGRVGSKVHSFNGIDSFSSIKSLKENMEADGYSIG